MNFETKLDAKNPSAPAPLPPPPPQFLQPNNAQINIKTIVGSSVSNARLIQHVPTIKKRPLFDIEIAATVK